MKLRETAKNDSRSDQIGKILHCKLIQQGLADEVNLFEEIFEYGRYSHCDMAPDRDQPPMTNYAPVWPLGWDACGLWKHMLLKKWYPRPSRRNIHSLFQTKMAKSVPYFRLEMLENDTLWGSTYLYGLYMGEPPPAPPPGLLTKAKRQGAEKTTRCCRLGLARTQNTDHVRRKQL